MSVLHNPTDSPNKKSTKFRSVKPAKHGSRDRRVAPNVSKHATLIARTPKEAINGEL